MFAKEIVKEAGDYILAHMQEDLHIERKSSPTDLVTRLDKEVQNFLVDKIRSRLQKRDVYVLQLDMDLFGSLIPLMVPTTLSHKVMILPLW